MEMELEGIDRGIAIFLMVFAIGFLAIGAVVMVLFWRERNAFEINQRSAYLVMLTGVSFLAVICKIMVNQIEGVFGYDKNVYIAKTERYHVVACFLLGVAAMFYPLHYMATNGNTDATENEFIDKADRQLWIISLAAKLIVILLHSLVW
eukprot:g13965.t1